MKFVKQSDSLKLENICKDAKRCTFHRHGKLLPNTIRCVVAGPSNCGKTNMIVGLLLHEKGLRYHNVYLYSKTLYQPKYVFLEKVYQLVPQVKFYKFHDNEEVLTPHEAEVNSVFIFDDVVCENQNRIRDYFSLGRHKNIDSFYLSQTYSKIPKQLIRDNANLIIIFKQDDVNLRHVYDEHAANDMTWHQFKDMCSKIWYNPYHYLVINKDCKKNEGSYRMNFDTFVQFDS